MRRVSLGNFNCYKDAMINPLVQKKLEMVFHFLKRNENVYKDFGKQLSNSMQSVEKVISKENKDNRAKP